LKKLDLGQTLGILANVGVIAGIVFLGFELRQNNSFLAAQARSQLTANRISANEMELEPENLSVINKARNGEELTQEETLRLRLFANGIFVRWEAEYRELAAGMYTTADLPLEGYRQSFSSFPGLRDRWQTRKHTADPGFVQFMEENVVNER
jgi:hypothetical protein